MTVDLVVLFVPFLRGKREDWKSSGLRTRKMEEVIEIKFGIG
jgi:hypothetical protein